MDVSTPLVALVAVVAVGRSLELLTASVSHDSPRSWNATNGTSAEDITDTASKLIDREGGLTPFFKNVGIGGIGYAIILEIISGVSSTSGLLLGPLRALGRGLILLIDGTFVNLLETFDAGTAATVRSFMDGVGAALGPLAQPVSLGIVMVTLGVFILALNRMSISPLSFIQSIRN